MEQVSKRKRDVEDEDDDFLKKQEKLSDVFVNILIRFYVLLLCSIVRDDQKLIVYNQLTATIELDSEVAPSVLNSYYFLLIPNLQLSDGTHLFNMPIGILFSIFKNRLEYFLDIKKNGHDLTRLELLNDVNLLLKHDINRDYSLFLIVRNNPDLFHYYNVNMKPELINMGFSLISLI